MRVTLAPDALVEVSDKGSTITVHDAVRGGALVYRRKGGQWISEHGGRSADITIIGETLLIHDDAVGALEYTADPLELGKLFVALKL